MGDRYRRPEHWLEADWEAKARENPLLAIMTTPEMAEAPAEAFSGELLEEFFARGRKLFDQHLRPLLADAPEGPVVEYGCGAGRIMKAVIDSGRPCAGIDISPTMLERCSELLPEAQALYLLSAEGRCAAPDGLAALVYSYSVLQHISTLGAYVTALDEMCRILASGGRMAIQVNSEDFKEGLEAPPYRTENFETYSLHYRPTRTKVYKRHEQDHWSGVYIGYDLLVRLLAERGVRAERWYYHNPRKLRALWVIGRKA